MEENSSYAHLMTAIAQGFEVAAALVLVVGLLLSAAFALRTWVQTRDGTLGYHKMREAFGGVLLLGLEILVAGDLIRTVAVAPTIDNVLVLGLIVLIRTFLSFSLEVEIDGVLPWRRGFVSGASVIKRAVASPKQEPPPVG